MAGKSVENQISNLRPIIIAMLKRDGRNFDMCELCGHPTDGRPILHHTKYDGATYRDLFIICWSCNNRSENQMLN